MDQDKANYIINLTTIILSLISLIGSSIIILSYLSFPKLRTFALQLVVWLSVSDFGGNISDLLGNPEDGTAICEAQAWLKQFFRLSEVTWTTVISYTLFQTIVNHERSQDRKMWPLHLYAWGLPFVFTVIPATTNSYGYSGPWCWIAETNVQEFDLGTSYRFFLFYIPLWIAITFNILVYVKVIQTVKRASLGAQTSATTKLLKLCNRLKMYPMIMVLCWSFATINRIQNAIEPDNPTFALFFMHSCLISLQGLFNSIAYGMSPQVRAAWRSVYIEWSQKGQNTTRPDDAQKVELHDTLTIGGEIDSLQAKDVDLT